VGAWSVNAWMCCGECGGAQGMHRLRVCRVRSFCPKQQLFDLVTASTAWRTRTVWGLMGWYGVSGARGGAVGGALETHRVCASHLLSIAVLDIPTLPCRYVVRVV
jgi:hypothetical protein